MSEKLYSMKETSKKKCEVLMSRGRGQYEKIKWWTIKFDEPHKTPDGLMVSGYHIKNYRISKNDVERAVLKYDEMPKFDWKAAEKKFNEVSGPRHVDFDPKSGNFHKSLQDKFQIVLVKEGTKPAGPGTELTTKLEMITELENHQRYFPNIDDYDSKMTLEEAKKEMFDYLGIRFGTKRQSRDSRQSSSEDEMNRRDVGRLDLLIVQKANCANIASNLVNASDAKFERFFEKIYRLDKQFLASWIKNNREKITAEQFQFAKDFYSERGWDIRWKKSLASNPPCEDKFRQPERTEDEA